MVLSLALMHVVEIREVHGLNLACIHRCCGEVIPEGVISRSAGDVILGGLIIDIEDEFVVG